MKRQTTLIPLLLLLTALACVCNGGTNPPPTAVEVEPTDTVPPTSVPPAGQLTPEEDIVEVGPALNALEQLVNRSPFFGGDVLRVTDGGQVLMEIGADFWLRLFNDTQLDVVSVEAAENTPLDVRLFLEDGGFTGQLTAEGGQAQFETPNGVTVTVAGTTFFVGYNTASAETYAINFEGDILIDDGSTTYRLPPDNWVMAPSGRPEQFRPVTFEQFQTRLRRSDAPIETAGQLECPDFEGLELIATKVELGFDLEWEAAGGCAPYSGTLTGTFAGDQEPFATYDINEPSGGLFDQPPVQCEGTFLVLYELILADAVGRERTAIAEGEILYIC